MNLNNNEKPVIFIEEKPEVIDGQGAGEVPVIIVEHDKEPKGTLRKRSWIPVLITFVVTALFCLIVWGGFKYYRLRTYIGVPISVTSEENIEKLKARTTERETPEVVLSKDSILGVAINLYELRGLKAEISMQEPDTTDTSVYLYSRCSDYHKDNSIIGSLVIDGEEMESVDNRRLGYLAGADDNFVIGIARDEEAKEYVKKHSGCFFRQFILVSAGKLPPKYYLHGKVERRALGRIVKEDSNGNSVDVLYYIESLHKETMYAFADALREYGFIDAIYITGGNDYCFYRDADGIRHDISNPNKYPHKNAGQIPWLIFRNK